ncbi:MAG: FAD-binding oxidoreductase [Planctomycetota bacterium]
MTPRHAGDGNIHTRIVKPPDWALEKWQAELPRLLAELYELTASLGGRISGEHGIGHKRKQYMPMFVSADQIEMMRAVKRALDPNNILNPGQDIRRVKEQAGRCSFGELPPLTGV